MASRAKCGEIVVVALTLCATSWSARDRGGTDQTKPLGEDRGGEVAHIVNSVGMEFVRIPAGSFVMGTPDEGYQGVLPPEVPPHSVQITRSFYQGVYEVTQDQFQAVMGSNPSHHRALSANGENGSFPVENVSWYEASDFCRKVSALAEEARAGRRYRLPTEAEWEYCCRSGQSVPYPFSRDPERQSQTGENGGRMLVGLHIGPVGAFSASSFGLHDMRGNVFEWCADWYARDYYAHSPAQDPEGPATGYFKVFRGSDWVFAGDGCTLGRQPTLPSARNPYIGFRVVCEVTSDDVR